MKEVKKELPKILITNDDSIYAPGIRALVEAALPFGEIYVVAPDKPQSGMGHAISVHNPLTIKEVPDLFDAKVKAWKVSGTPADCVKLAIHKVFHGSLPNFCFSGINHGANHSINVIYSGTMSAAMEASIEGIPSIGFSLLDLSLEANFDAAKFYIGEIIQKLVHRNISKHLCLNVNFPAIPLNMIQGIKICRQAKAKYEEAFTEKLDNNNEKVYWLTGAFTNLDNGNDTDVWALANNYVSIVPVQPDMTNHHLRGQLDKLLKF